MAGITSVTQITDKSTGVTLHKMEGRIVTSNAALNAGVEVTFTVTNNRIKSEDLVVVNHVSGSTLGAYDVVAHSIIDGSFKLTLTNMSAGNLSEAITLGFQVKRSNYT